MPEWKLNIFVSAIKIRIIRENRTAEDILAEYPKLSDDDKAEIKAAL